MDLDPEALATAKQETAAAFMRALGVSQHPAAATARTNHIGSWTASASWSAPPPSPARRCQSPDSWLRVMMINLNRMFHCNRQIVPLVPANG